MITLEMGGGVEKKLVLKSQFYERVDEYEKVGMKA